MQLSAASRLVWRVLFPWSPVEAGVLMSVAVWLSQPMGRYPLHPLSYLTFPAGDWFGTMSSALMVCPTARNWAYDTHRNKAGWYNNEKQYYSQSRAENARVESGALIITVRKERLTAAADYGNQDYSSARLYTKGKANWTYGRWEIRAKLPCALGTWPAIWMLGDGIPDSGTWPLDGEIDIMEQKGFDAGEKTRVLGTVHTQAFHAGTSKGASIYLPTACTQFNTYQMEWDEERIQIGVNGAFYFNYVNPKNGDVNEWPFFRPQHLLLNVALGGVLGGSVRDDQLPAQMEIDYVRVYQR
jgi:beta-glucanase (GH16 family)